jgi:glycosyltransferase involved in cell wall biosynthesis
MRTVLIVTRSFPPNLDVGGKRAYHFARYLPLYGWQAVVLTNPLSRNAVIDPSWAGLPIGVVDPTYHPSWWPQPHVSYSSSLAPIAENSAYGRMCRLISLPLGPDLLLTPLVILRGVKRCRRLRAMVVMATGGPASALLDGYLISKMANVPIVLDFRDPWSLSHLQARKPQWIQWAERKVERLLIKAADQITFTSEDTCAEYGQLYPAVASRMTTILTGFDPAFASHRRPPTGPITLVHFGNCFAGRSLAIVLRAIAALRTEASWPQEGVNLLNFGRVQQKDLKLAYSLGIADLFECRPRVPHAEGMAVMGGADLLVLLGYSQETSHIPAKTYDYFIAGRPVLCLARASALARLIQQSGAGRVVDPDDLASIKIAILEAASNRMKGYVPIARECSISQYDASITTGRLAGLLDRVLADRVAVVRPAGHR